MSNVTIYCEDGVKYDANFTRVLMEMGKFLSINGQVYRAQVQGQSLSDDVKRQLIDIGFNVNDSCELQTAADILFSLWDMTTSGISSAWCVIVVTQRKSMSRFLQSLTQRSVHVICISDFESEGSLDENSELYQASSRSIPLLWIRSLVDRLSTGEISNVKEIASTVLDAPHSASVDERESIGKNSSREEEIWSYENDPTLSGPWSSPVEEPYHAHIQNPPLGRLPHRNTDASVSLNRRSLNQNAMDGDHQIVYAKSDTALLSKLRYGSGGLSPASQPFEPMNLGGGGGGLRVSNTQRWREDLTPLALVPDALSIDQKILQDDLITSVYAYNVNGAVSTLRKMYTKQTRTFRIPTVLAHVLPDTSAMMTDGRTDLLNIAVCFTLDCIQWCFGVQKGENIESFKYKMNANIARWILREMIRKGVPLSPTSVIVDATVFVVNHILENVPELEFAYDMLTSLHVPHVLERMIPNFLSWRSVPTPAVEARVNEFLYEHPELGSLLSGSPISGTQPGNRPQAVAGDRAQAFIRDHLMFSSSGSDFAIPSVPPTIDPELQVLERKLLKLLAKSPHGELGARIPALYREEYGEALRLRGKKLKDILIDSGKVEMVGYDGPGDKKFRLKSLGSQAVRFPPSFSTDPNQPPSEYVEDTTSYYSSFSSDVSGYDEFQSKRNFQPTYSGQYGKLDVDGNYSLDVPETKANYGHDPTLASFSQFQANNPKGYATALYPNTLSPSAYGESSYRHYEDPPESDTTTLENASASSSFPHSKSFPYDFSR